MRLEVVVLQVRICKESQILAVRKARYQGEDVAVKLFFSLHAKSFEQYVEREISNLRFHKILAHIYDN